MDETKKWYKSKTINFNALFLAIISVLNAAGVTIPNEYIAIAQTILNLILRSITKEPIGIFNQPPTE